MSKLHIFERFLSVGNLKPKFKRFFKPKLKPKMFSIESPPCRFVDPDGLGVGVAVEAATLQEQVALPDDPRFRRSIHIKDLSVLRSSCDIVSYDNDRFFRVGEDNFEMYLRYR